MAELSPNWLQELCYTAQVDRLMIANLVAAEGVSDVVGGDLLVTTGGSGLNVSIAQGGAFVEGDDDDRGVYSVYNDAAVTKTATAANATNPRIDTVVARVYDSTYGEGADNWALEILAGTPTVGATLANLTGAASLTGINAIPLAYLLVPATFTGPFVNATHIRDARTSFVLAGTPASPSSFVRVYRNAAFNIPTVAADLVFDTVSFGNTALFNTATGIYTAPSTGFCRVSYSIGFTGSGENEVDINLIANGVTIVQDRYRETTASLAQSFNGSQVLPVTAGQAVKISSVNSSGGALTGTNNTNATFASFEMI